MSNSGNNAWMPGLFLFLTTMLSLAGTSALFFPYNTVTSLHFSAQSLLSCFACIPTKAVCVTKQLKEPGQGPQHKICHSLLSLATSESLAFNDIYTLRDTQIQKGLPRQSSPCATTHLAASGLWEVSALPPPSHPSRWTQGMGVRLTSDPHPLLPWQYIPGHSWSVCNLGSPWLSADRRFQTQFCDKVAHLLAFLGRTGFWGRLHWWSSFARSGANSSPARILTKLLFFFIFSLQGNFISSFQEWTWLMQSLHLPVSIWIIRRNQIWAPV